MNVEQKRNKRFLFYWYFLYNLLVHLKTTNTQVKKGPTFMGLKHKTEDQLKPFYSFRSIPYALPPVGDLRFKPPVAILDYGTLTIRAYDESPSCAQSITPSILIGNEDCLYLSVYTPTIKCNPSQLHSVMVWIHGGFFEIGGHTYSTYHPDYFLNEGVIVVTVNYRLGILGFLNTEDMESPGNYGLKDQIVALKWVKRHIKFFCGDENNVTIFGESAGSISISYLTQSHLTKGLFHRAILQSGTSLCLWGLTRKPKQVAMDIGKTLNLNTSSTKALVDDLRTIKFEELVTIATLHQYKNVALQRKVEAFMFGPSIEPNHSGAVISNPSHQNLVNGDYHKIPYIIGLNSGEAFPFIKVMHQYMHWYLVKFKTIPTALVSDSMNIENIAKKLAVNQHIKTKFFKNSNSEFDNFYNFFNDDLFVRPILETVRLYSQRSPVFMYVFSYRGTFSTPIADDESGLVGHGEELSYLFRNAYVPLTLNNQDLRIRRKLIMLWTNFAKNGNPTPNKEDVLENIVWQNINDDNNLVYLNISEKLQMSSHFHDDYFSFWKTLIELFGNPPFSTY